MISLLQAGSVKDELLRLSRSTLRPATLVLRGPRGAGSAEVANELSSGLSGATPELLEVLRAIKGLNLVSFDVPLHLSDVDEMSLAACTQLTELRCINSFPGLSQLTQLRRLSIDSSIDSLPVLSQLAFLPHLAHLVVKK
ncbi:hypothetical protein HaLaN_29084, partial [Haematococcus lacustris]